MPEVLDEVHALIEKTRTPFILTGSSARKLKRRSTNLLAGRAVTPRLQHGRIRVAAKIKAKSRIAGADLGGLRSFSEAHPKAPLVVVPVALEEHRIGSIDVLPYRISFQRQPDWL